MKLFEDIISSYLQTNGFFLIRNINYEKNQKIGVIATKYGCKNAIWHIEIDCSSKPLLQLGSNNSKETNYEKNAMKYLRERFFNDSVIAKIKKIACWSEENDIRIINWFFHADLKESNQLKVFKANGIDCFDLGIAVVDLQDVYPEYVAGELGSDYKQLLEILSRKDLDNLDRLEKQE
jgi:hypothetical protein